MKYKAVIFDLFGTLVENYTVERHESVLRQMASALSSPPEDFIRLWYETFDDRCLGILKTPEDNINYVCCGLGLAIEDTQRREAARIRMDLTVNSMVPVPYAIDVLSYLKEEAYKTGLVTDCSSEVPAVWQDTPFAPLFDITVFSCLAGLKKPDPGIYNLAAKQLDVIPEDCLYIGDGSSNELTGAAAVGMHPVLIRDPQEESGVMHRVEAEADRWNGPVITSLKEVLDLVK
ncbi:HAD family hydrolase [Chloroflexota bacterium]